MEYTNNRSELVQPSKIIDIEQQITQSMHTIKKFNVFISQFKYTIIGIIGAVKVTLSNGNNTFFI